MLENSDHELKTMSMIQPGCSKRITLPVKKISLSNAEAAVPIPQLDKSRQFVVPKVGVKHGNLRIEVFNVREALLKQMKCEWRYVSWNCVLRKSARIHFTKSLF